MSADSLQRSRTVALLLTVSLHVLLVAPSLSGAGASGGAAARAAVHGSAKPATTVLTWIEPAVSSAASVFATRPTVHPQPLPLEPLNIELTQAAAEPIPTEDSVPEYVRRMAALTARIQSLWVLPRVRPAADFRCRARLRPGESGSLDEVELEDCDDSAPVRASIAQAIEHAMPLPLPQEQPGSSTDIVLQFSAYAGPNGTRHTSIQPAAH